MIVDIVATEGWKSVVDFVLLELNDVRVLNFVGIEPSDEVLGYVLRRTDNVKRFAFINVDFDRVCSFDCRPCVRLEGRGTVNNRWGYNAKYMIEVGEDLFDLLNKGYRVFRVRRPDSNVSVEYWRDYLKRLVQSYFLILVKGREDVWIENFMLAGYNLRRCSAGKDRIAIDGDLKVWPCWKLVGTEYEEGCVCDRKCNCLCLGEKSKCKYIREEDIIVQEWLKEMGRMYFMRREEDVVQGRLRLVLGLR